ncbi:HPC2-domain-containing protein [Aspergillus sclerotioniger CBS 115572]|uniref:HPC2-domain-containing protein n=1 Tax=Aspergillus sclerotioniger CBS 115572 TaxID=1450535 RepID=A0A317W0E3_9EURO|nr:HPC2-domain-containing protein [Aspergillus sclerotioniger CBS 115572]PWY79369.1 HPC2-domain-containing protein [Aspergillus sclerotioniger CBS 115572]
MSTEPSILSAAGEHESRSPIDYPARETRTRRSRRKKEDDLDLERKEAARTTKSREKEKEKEEKLEPKRGSRRQREKSSSTFASPATSAASHAHARKKPKLEAATPDQSPRPAAVPTPSSIAVPAAPVPATSPPTTAISSAPVAPAPAPAPAPALAPAPRSPAPSTPITSPRKQILDPESMSQNTNRLLNPPSLPSSAHPTPPSVAPTTLVSSYPALMPSAPPPPPPPRPHSQPPAPPPQRTSGQNFDPIRSAFDTASPAIAPAPTQTLAPAPAPVPTSFSPPARHPSPRPTFRASASPAIASIIDPPTTSSPPVYTSRPYGSPIHGASSYSPSPVGASIVPTPPQPHPQSQPQPRPISPYALRSPYAAPIQAPPPQKPQIPAPAPKPIPAAPPPASQPPTPVPAPSNNRPPSPGPTPMDVEPDTPATLSAPKTTKKESKSPSTVPASKAPSPKPARAAKEAPALPQGSGLISNALFGVEGSSSSGDASNRRTPSIVLHVPLKGHGNQIINFARLAEEQYGFAALHPRLAAHKERLARVAAAGAALERNDKASGRGLSAGESADEDLSMEIDRDTDMDGEGTMAAPTRSNCADPADGKKKRRKKKMEEYDRDDPFVDDSELAWQEQAAASKDGFFVYSGPLVPEGEKVQVERADGTIKRGRGRGRGGRGRGPPSSHHQVPLAAAVPISQETGLPVRGPGSRGGSTTRRPRISKAARLQAEQERANAASATSHGRGGGATGRGGSTSTRGGKNPMVELAPRPNIAPAPPGPSPMSGPEITMK